MTVKEYLNQAYYIDREINMTLAKADKLRKSLYGKRQKLDDIGGGKASGTCDTIGDTMALVVDYEKKANDMVNKLVEKRLEIERTIKCVPDDVQREVLERRYLLFQPWDSGYDKVTGEYIKGIYESMNFSRRQIFNLHGKALDSVALNCIELHLKK